MKSEGLRGHLDLLLLDILSRTPGHGYAVIGALREQSGGVLDLTEGAVYPALHRLENRGLLASEWQPVAGRRRRVYATTVSGRKALHHQRHEWQLLASAIEAVLGSAELGPGPTPAVSGVSV